MTGPGLPAQGKIHQWRVERDNFAHKMNQSDTSRD
jgi:hypothetical protein